MSAWLALESGKDETDELDGLRGGQRRPPLRIGKALDDLSIVERRPIGPAGDRRAGLLVVDHEAFIRCETLNLVL